MFIMGATDYPLAKPGLKGTLWNCQKCHSFALNTFCTSSG